MRIHTIFRFELGIRRVLGKEWAPDRVGRENMSHQEQRPRDKICIFISKRLTLCNLSSLSLAFECRSQQKLRILSKENCSNKSYCISKTGSFKIIFWYVFENYLGEDRFRKEFLSNASILVFLSPLRKRMLFGQRFWFFHTSQ